MNYNMLFFFSSAKYRTTICDCSATTATAYASTISESSKYGTPNIAKTPERVIHLFTFSQMLSCSIFSRKCQNINFFLLFIVLRPPITSGSMTLGHPNKQAKHQEAMLAANVMQQQGPPIHPQQMRQQNMGMGTQTLGRHHSPNHMRNNSGKYILRLNKQDVKF